MVYIRLEGRALIGTEAVNQVGAVLTEQTYCMDEIFAVIALVFAAWLMYLLPAVPLSILLCYVGRKRAQFSWWELSVFLLPFIIWLSCFQLLSNDKSLGNIVEVLVLGSAVPVAALIRVLIGRNLNQTFVATGLIGAVCLIAVLLGAMFPKLPFHWFH